MTAPGDAQSIAIEKPAAETFAFIADPARLDLWSFGTWKTRRRDDGLIEGKSIFDGATILLRVDPCESRLLVDYWLGADARRLQPRIYARVTPGAVAGLPADHCVLTLAALRAAGMSDERWRRLTASHGFELQLLKRLIETGYDHRTR